MLAVAIHLQRFYPQFLERGFPFKSGLRIAMNYGEYRLMPLEGGPAGGTARYEFFGHGLVELSRLSTGKKTQELEEFKTYLISQGYPEPAVNKFFSPLIQSNSELVSKIEEQRRFYAYINQNSALINEGIVATEPFVSRLGTFGDVLRQGQAAAATSRWCSTGGRRRLVVGVRKLGLSRSSKAWSPWRSTRSWTASDWDPQGAEGESRASRLLAASGTALRQDGGGQESRRRRRRSTTRGPAPREALADD